MHKKRRTDANLVSEDAVTPVSPINAVSFWARACLTRPPTVRSIDDQHTIHAESLIQCGIDAQPANDSKTNITVCLLTSSGPLLQLILYGCITDCCVVAHRCLVTLSRRPWWCSCCCRDGAGNGMGPLSSPGRLTCTDLRRKQAERQIRRGWALTTGTNSVSLECTRYAACTSH